jgi:hypothetical protein
LSFCSEGNNFFKAKDYRNAIEKYSEAIDADPTDVTFFSNRRFVSATALILISCQRMLRCLGNVGTSSRRWKTMHRRQ